MKIILNHLHSKEKTSLAASSQKIGTSLITDKLPCQAGNTGKLKWKKNDGHELQQNTPWENELACSDDSHSANQSEHNTFEHCGRRRK